MSRRLIPIALAYCLVAPLAIAQAATAAGSYRLQFWVDQSQAGKPAAVSTYTLLVGPNGNYSSIQSGERVPVRIASDKIEYENVGLSLNCRLDSNAKGMPPNQIGMQVQVSLNTIAPNSAPLQPVFASNDSHISTTVPIGQRVSIARFEDAATHATYQLEVEATPAAPTAANSQANSNDVSRNRS
ncbi:MAG TPA: hypothetical protein VN690_10370 [Terriglobales bacterium]|nr:hypothetical protein [Terriglobales bacterium]